MLRRIVLLREFDRCAQPQSAATRATACWARERALVKRILRQASRYDAGHADVVFPPLVSAVSPSSPPPALSAFLRGVERRGAVLAELQCGDAGVGDAALVAAMRSFREGAAAVPMAEWPRRFWAKLLEEPALRQRVPVALALDPTDRLGDVPTGPRAALLLRLAAGLSEPEAASVLGVGEASYRLALRSALPHHGDGRADPQAWHHLRDQVHRRIKTLSPERLTRLAQAREALLRGEAGAPGAAAPPLPVVQRRRPRRVLAVLWTLLLLCGLALAATWWWPERALGAGWGGGVRIEPLPAAAPAATLSAEAALVAHPDFALLADPATEANATDLAFRAWLAAVEAGTVPAERPPGDAPEPGAAPPLQALPDAGVQPLESADEEEPDAAL